MRKTCSDNIEPTDVLNRIHKGSGHTNDADDMGSLATLFTDRYEGLCNITFEPFATKQPGTCEKLSKRFVRRQPISNVTIQCDGETPEHVCEQMKEDCDRHEVRQSYF
jgi:hypothetical protein